MIIKVDLSALRLKDIGEKELEVNIATDGKVKDIFEHFDLLEKRDIIAMVNGTRREWDYALREGDVIGIFPILEGG